MDAFQYSVILGNLGNTCDRFMPGGYKAPVTKADLVKLAASIEGITGLELLGGADVTPANAQEMGSVLRDHGLACVSILPDLFSRREWGLGSFCARDAKVRQLAVDETRRAAAIAQELGCGLVNLWLGQDGYDYPLQGDFERQRGWMVEGIRSVAAEWPGLRFALEYKPKEPRIRSFQARAADTLLMAQETGLPNVGVCLDVGHAFVAQENAAESVWLLQHYGRRLFHMHYNDNYGHWDDDMIVGSVHLTCYLELFYWLKQTGFAGWHSMDLYPYREDGRGAVAESVAFLRNVEAALTDARRDEIGRLIATGDATASARWVREFIFNRSERATPGKAPAGA